MSVKLAIAGAVVLAAAAIVYLRTRGDGARPDARRLVAEGAVLLDVRSPEEFADRHLDGALNIPVQTLAVRLADLPDKQRPIVVYCRSGARSARAAELLRQAGYASVHDLGPMSAW